MEKMNIYKANIELKHLSNDITYYEEKKELLFNKTQPTSKELSGDQVQGGGKSDLMLEYVAKIEEIDKILEELQKEAQIVSKYIDSELKRIGEYDSIAKKIYELRLDPEYMRTHGGKKRPWWIVSENVGYCERQCRRIFNKITK